MKQWLDNIGKWHRGSAPSNASEGLRGKVRGQIQKELGGKWEYCGLLMEWRMANSKKEAKQRVEEIDRAHTEPGCASPY